MQKKRPDRNHSLSITAAHARQYLPNVLDTRRHPKFTSRGECPRQDDWHGPTPGELRQHAVERDGCTLRDEPRSAHTGSLDFLELVAKWQPCRYPAGLVAPIVNLQARGAGVPEEEKWKT